MGASQPGLPVSTAHVSVGSISGVGAGANSLNWGALRNIYCLGGATLPMAAHRRDHIEIIMKGRRDGRDHDTGFT